MKILLALAVVIAVVWMLRSARHRDSEKKRGVSPTIASPPGPQNMLPCIRCGIHLPLVDMVTGSKGQYCSQEHRLQSEGR
jgi:uncharacterized protein